MEHRLRCAQALHNTCSLDDFVAAREPRANPTRRPEMGRERHRFNEPACIKIWRTYGAPVNQLPEILRPTRCIAVSWKVGTTVDERQREREVETDKNASSA
jgi:hypothetical protein